MGTESHLEGILVLENNAWRAATNAELRALARTSDSASYILENGSGKWYEAQENVAAWAASIDREVIVQLRTYERCRVHATQGGYSYVAGPMLIWNSPPWRMMDDVPVGRDLDDAMEEFGAADFCEE